MSASAKIVETILAGENKFTAHATLSLNSHSTRNCHFEGPESIKVPFSLDIEYRDWGIKGISVDIDPAPVTFSYKVIIWGEPDDEEEIKEVSVDLHKLRREDTYEKGHVTVSRVNLYLKDNGDVDYEGSEIEINGAF